MMHGDDEAALELLRIREGDDVIFDQSHLKALSGQAEEVMAQISEVQSELSALKMIRSRLRPMRLLSRLQQLLDRLRSLTKMSII